MLIEITTRMMQVFGVVICSEGSDCKFQVDIIEVSKRELLVLGNLYYNEILEANSYLKGGTDDHDTKERLLVHIMLGTGER